METATRPAQRIATAQTAALLLAPAGGAAAVLYDARLGMLSGAVLLGWSQLVGL
jgi:hypothetical protein